APPVDRRRHRRRSGAALEVRHGADRPRVRLGAVARRPAGAAHTVAVAGGAGCCESVRAPPRLECAPRVGTDPLPAPAWLPGDARRAFGARHTAAMGASAG